MVRSTRILFLEARAKPLEFNKGPKESKSFLFQKGNSFHETNLDKVVVFSCTKNMD